ncbi:MAG: hypothetical protein J2P25_26655, partial [Nocardiopsaceae bacterium]|nr:hypothetical protein [Nocardiopsaceae bacterium]
MDRSTVVPGDVWHEFSPAFRKEAFERSSEAVEGIHGGLPGSTGPWLPMRPLFLHRSHFAEVGELSLRLMELILGACRRRAGTAGELEEALRVPPGRVSLLQRSEPLHDGLLVAARPDIVYDSGVPKFVEFNIEGNVGGTLQADMLSRRFGDVYGPIEDGCGLAIPGSSVDARFSAIRSSLGLADGDLVAIPVFRQGALPGAEEPEAFIDWLAPVCESGKRHGLDTVACTMDQLKADDNAVLRLDGRRVDAVFRLFLSYDQPASPGLDALTSAMQAGQVRMHTSETSWLLSDKTTLAWLWEDRPLLA